MAAVQHYEQVQHMSTAGSGSYTDSVLPWSSQIGGAQQAVKPEPGLSDDRTQQDAWKAALAAMKV